MTNIQLPSGSSGVWSGAFWKAVAERAFWTFIQAFFGVMSAGEVFNVITFNWPSAAVVALSSAVFAFVKGAIAQYVGDKGSPSLGGGEQLSR